MNAIQELEICCLTAYIHFFMPFQLSSGGLESDSSSHSLSLLESLSMWAWMCADAVESVRKIPLRDATKMRSGSD